MYSGKIAVPPGGGGIVDTKENLTIINKQFVFVSLTTKCSSIYVG
jgi:hypothetical protein